jgi:hypothetical protein
VPCQQGATRRAQRQRILPRRCELRSNRGGEEGIRTLGTLLYTAFPMLRLRPLGHLSTDLNTGPCFSTKADLFPSHWGPKRKGGMSERRLGFPMHRVIQGNPVEVAPIECKRALFPRRRVVQVIIGQNDPLHRAEMRSLQFHAPTRNHDAVRLHQAETIRSHWSSRYRHGTISSPCRPDYASTETSLLGLLGTSARTYRCWSH